MKKKDSPTCPKCGADAIRQETRYGARFSCCGLWAWGNNPLADGDTHKARQAAHAAFDPIWRSKKLSRTEAYQKLATALAIEQRHCHMKKMDVATARKVPDIAAEILRQISVAQEAVRG